MFFLFSCVHSLDDTHTPVSDYYLEWLVAVLISASLLIVDFMFFGTNAFVFDPQYRSWQTVTHTDKVD
ncbi:MAG: hypothetical protein MHM6MM_003665 [Cercozoa sp. M6MM]